MNIFYIEYSNWRENYIAYVSAENKEEARTLLVEEYDLDSSYKSIVNHILKKDKWVLYTDK